MVVILIHKDIKIYHGFEQGEKWLNRYDGCRPIFTCTLGFTETALIEGISAAGATASSRRYTAVADAEFLVNGVSALPRYPLPPLSVGISPTFITRAVVETLQLPVYIFNAGLPVTPSVPVIDLQGKPARCLSTGNAMSLTQVKHLYQQGLMWGKKLARENPDSYLILSECVVGGTTTALGVLRALGINGMVNSSHPVCNHDQKEKIVQEGLQRANLPPSATALDIVGAVGDPMQVFVAGMALSASGYQGVMLAGGTQMLAVLALMQRLVRDGVTGADFDNIIVATTRWVAEDTTGDTVALAHMVADIPLCATQLNFSNSIYPSLQAYEQGFVKEGVGAGGSAVASHLLQLSSSELMIAVEGIIALLL